LVDLTFVPKVHNGVQVYCGFFTAEICAIKFVSDLIESMFQTDSLTFSHANRNFQLLQNNIVLGIVHKITDNRIMYITYLYTMLENTLCM
jgi:hypothetical protein